MNNEEIELNDYFLNKINGISFSLLGDEEKKSYIEDAEILSKLGVDNKEKELYSYNLFNYIPDILEDILGQAVNHKYVYSIIAVMVNDMKNYPIQPEMINLFDSVASAAMEIGLPVSESVINKIQNRKNASLFSFSYPQGYDQISMKPYDLEKWMQATRDIYLRSRNGYDFSDTFDEITKFWDKKEKMDFGYWLRFYQENAHNKYKIAQHMMDAGYYIPNVIREDLRSELPVPFRVDNTNSKQVEKPKPKHDTNDVRMTIEQQRSRIIGRLNSAEKLLASMEGQYFAGDDQEYMLKLLQDLKRKIQTANKIRISSSLFHDYIYRTAYMLDHIGKEKASRFFLKVAQEGPPDDPAEALLGESVGGEKEEDLPGEGPDQDIEDFSTDLSMDMGGSVAVDSTRAALKEFFELLETGVSDLDDGDLHAADDTAFIVVEAQDTPIEAELPPDEAAPVSSPIEAPGRNISKFPPPKAVSAPPQKPIQEPAEHQEDYIEDAFEKALEGITVKDVVDRLELVSGLFKKREIARQLAIIDIMMDKLGFGSFFPSLGEATRSALESNQYVATRIEDILSKLRGSIESETADSLLDLTKKEEITPENSSLRQHLDNQQEREDQVREQRKKRDQEKILGNQEPKQEAAEELGEPVNVQRSQPIPVR